MYILHPKNAQWHIIHCFTGTVYKSHPSRLTTTYSVYQLETCAVDNIIIQCVDDGASDGRSDNCHIGHWAIGRRRCRVVTTINQCK